jgi:hypothetical protein
METMKPYILHFYKFGLNHTLMFPESRVGSLPLEEKID